MKFTNFEEKLKKMKQNNGITLIALVVTIIVILIIAGVSITTLTGDNGIITRTIEAKQKIEEAKDKQELQLNFLESQMMPSWDGSVASKFPNEDEANAGEESNPYKITNGAELAYLAKCVNEGNSFENKYVSIEKSINLGFHEFEPIGKGMLGQHDEKTWNLTQNSFAGTLNGNGHTITGLQITQTAMNGVGLIGVMESSGTVENLNIYEGTITGRTSVGAFVGASKGTIKNCINTANVIGKDDKEVDNSGEIVGGIVGWTSAGMVDGCINNGNIIGKNESMKVSRGKLVGGIIGYIGSSESITISIKNCTNNGKITTQYQQSGGIIGSVQCSENVVVSIENCKNTGEVVAEAKKDDLTNTGLSEKSIGLSGGIIGWLVSDGEIKNCTNSGKVTAAYSSAGGIVGSMDTGSEKIEKCTNSGKVTAAYKFAGGIAGGMKSGTISECSNCGEISALESNVAGGIVGGMDTGSEKIEKCTNSGKVTAANQQAGGIAGYQKSGTISECSNCGEIYSAAGTSTAIGGGIVGMVDGTSTEVTKVYNQGTVKCEDNAKDGDRIGGIIGFIKSAKASAITKAYNKGSLIGGDSNCVGAIVGRNNASNAVSNCYYYFATESSIPGIGGTTATAEGNYLTGTTRSYTNYATRNDFLNGEGK